MQLPFVHEALGGYSYTVQLFLLNINVQCRRISIHNRSTTEMQVPRVRGALRSPFAIAAVPLSFALSRGLKNLGEKRAILVAKK